MTIMLFSALASAIKRFWLVAAGAAIAACLGLYLRFGSLAWWHVALIAGVAFLGILAVGLPLEYHKRTRAHRQSVPGAR